jgi:hypothetical protein
VVALAVTDWSEKSYTVFCQNGNEEALMPPTVFVFVSAMIACRPLIWFVSEPSE